MTGPDGAVVWESGATGGFDVNHTKYKTSKEEMLGPNGSRITHFNFGLRDPGDAMAEEAWDDFTNGLKGRTGFPRVLARVNGTVVPLPITIPVGKK